MARKPSAIMTKAEAKKMKTQIDKTLKNEKTSLRELKKQVTALRNELARAEAAVRKQERFVSKTIKNVEAMKKAA